MISCILYRYLHLYILVMKNSFKNIYICKHSKSFMIRCIIYLLTRGGSLFVHFFFNHHHRPHSLMSLLTLKETEWAEENFQFELCFIQNMSPWDLMILLPHQAHTYVKKFFEGGWKCPSSEVDNFPSINDRCHVNRKVLIQNSSVIPKLQSFWNTK